MGEEKKSVDETAVGNAYKLKKILGNVNYNQGKMLNYQVIDQRSENL